MTGLLKMVDSLTTNQMYIAIALLVLVIAVVIGLVYFMYRGKGKSAPQDTFMGADDIEGLDANGNVDANEHFGEGQEEGSEAFAEQGESNEAFAEADSNEAFAESEGNEAFGEQAQESFEQENAQNE